MLRLMTSMTRLVVGTVVWADDGGSLLVEGVDDQGIKPGGAVF